MQVKKLVASVAAVSILGVNSAVASPFANTSIAGFAFQSDSMGGHNITVLSDYEMQNTQGEPDCLTKLEITF